MYFVVYLSTLKRNVILPAEWIQNVEDHFEKFMNCSINSTQRFLCYYTTKDEAFIDGKPNKDYMPDFDLAILQEVNSNESFEGCFHGKLKKFKGKFLNDFKLFTIESCEKFIEYFAVVQ